MTETWRKQGGWNSALFRALQDFGQDAFNDMAMRGTAKFVLRDDGVLLMIIRNETKEEVLFKVTHTGLFCLAHLKT
jgi:hypothetical protein